MEYASTCQKTIDWRQSKSFCESDCYHQVSVYLLYAAEIDLVVVAELVVCSSFMGFQRNCNQVSCFPDSKPILWLRGGQKFSKLRNRGRSSAEQRFKTLINLFWFKPAFVLAFYCVFSLGLSPFWTYRWIFAIVYMIKLLSSKTSILGKSLLRRVDVHQYSIFWTSLPDYKVQQCWFYLDSFLFLTTFSLDPNTVYADLDRPRCRLLQWFASLHKLSRTWCELQ